MIHVTLLHLTTRANWDFPLETKIAKTTPSHNLFRLSATTQTMATSTQLLPHARLAFLRIITPHGRASALDCHWINRTCFNNASVEPLLPSHTILPSNRIGHRTIGCCWYGTQTQPLSMMAGHNKWSKIRHKKGANDVKRAKLFSKASKALAVAVKQANGDVENFQVQTALQHAKSVQLSKERIQDAIKKGQGGGKNDGSNEFESLRFDAMIPIKSQENDIGQQYQVACVITALSDNRNRTTKNVRHIVTKAGGEFLPTNTLDYVFQHVGMILVSISVSENDDDAASKEDQLIECALDAGAINVEGEEGEEEEDDDDQSNVHESGSENSNISKSRRRMFVVTTDEKDLYQVVTELRSSLPENSFQIEQFEHRYVLVDDEHGGVELDGDTDNEDGNSDHSQASKKSHDKYDGSSWQQLEDILEKLEDDDDVDQIYHNATLKTKTTA